MFEGWDGISWQLQPGFEARGGIMNAVSCSSAATCLAVGQVSFPGVSSPFAERWNGIAWDSKSPVPPSFSSGSLTGVSCLLAQYCVAVGNYSPPGGGELSFGERSVEQSTGNFQWTLLNTVNPSSSVSVLTGVSCAFSGVFAASCQAVGYEEGGPGALIAQAQAWDGSSWSYEVPAGTAYGTSDLLNGVSCQTQYECTAVGQYTIPTKIFTFSRTLAEQFTGGSGPHGLSLTRHGHVLALLRKPHKLELLVFKLGRRGRLLGSVTLGHHDRGRSLIRWNLRVAGRRLAPGTYMAELVAALGRGATTNGPSVKFALAYPAGPIRVLTSTCSVAAAARGRC